MFTPAIEAPKIGVACSDEEPGSEGVGALPERTPAVADMPLIRSARPEDFKNWLPLWDGYNRFYGRADATALDPAITEVTWKRFFDEREAVHALVAEDGGKLIGLTHYLFYRSTILVEPSCYLQDLFTTEEARGRGVGRALIEEVYRRAGAGGSSQVYWHTQTTNLTARRLYDGVATDAGFMVYRQKLADLNNISECK